MAALDRDALYYPNIQIDDVNWLKATLLCFPQVRRIRPEFYNPDDAPEIIDFQRVTGPRGEPLLVDEYTRAEDTEFPVRNAQERLLRLLMQNEELILRKYKSLRSSSKYRIHTGKMMWPLADYLFKSGMAVGTSSKWADVHRPLGEAIMSIIAIAIAQHKGLDIVTSSGVINHALSALDEEEVFVRLIGGDGQPKESAKANATDELAQLVMTNHFDLTKLSAKQIGQLVSDGKDLRSFKAEISQIAETLPEIVDVEEKRKRLREKAAEVIDKWKKYKQSLPKFALDAIIDTTDIKFPDFAAAIIAGGTGLALASGGGLAIGILVWKGAMVFRKYRKEASSPLNYLTKIEKAGASIVFPALR